jgi:uncharacterized membrane protein YgcG
MNRVSLLNSQPTRAPRLAIVILVVLSIIASLASCNRSPVEKVVEQSSAPSGGSTTPVPCSIPSDGNHVNDSAEVLNSDSKDSLEQKLDTLKSTAMIDFAVVTVKTTKEQPIADYSLALARCWDVGGNNADKSGLLLLLAVDDRKWHMQISRSIEKVLSNDEIQRAASLMTPHLRENNYSEGIHECVDATIRTLAARRGFSISTSKE